MGPRELFIVLGRLLGIWFVVQGIILVALQAALTWEFRQMAGTPLALSLMTPLIYVGSGMLLILQMEGIADLPIFQLHPPRPESPEGEEDSTPAAHAHDARRQFKEPLTPRALMTIGLRMAGTITILTQVSQLTILVDALIRRESVDIRGAAATLLVTCLGILFLFRAAAVAQFLEFKSENPN